MTRRDKSRAFLAALCEQTNVTTIVTETVEQAAVKALLQLFLVAAPITDFKQQLLTELQAGAPLTGKDGLRRRLAAADPEYFGRAYLSEYFDTKSPQFHRELDDIWTQGVMKDLIPLDSETVTKLSKMNGCRRVIMAPRGHAKSTNLTFKDTLHAVCYGYKHYAIILSDSSEQAEGFLRDIKIELEDNAALREDFGNLVGSVWKSNVILLANDCKVEALGAGKKIRGRRHKQWRPDLILCDDLENDENVNTPEQRKKLRNWFYKAVSKAGDTYTDIVYIGTLLHYDALLHDVSTKGQYHTVKYQGVLSFAKNQTLWDAWELLYNDLSNDRRKEDALAFFEAQQEEMLDGTEVLWADKHSYYNLMVMRITEGENSFNSEIQNNPIDPDNCIFNEEWFTYYDDDKSPPPDFADKRFLFVGANDPSLGKNKQADTSAIIVLAVDTKSGFMYVLIGDIERRKPDAIIRDAIETSRRLRREYQKPLYKFGVEVVQFQHFFKDVMVQVCREQGEYLPIEEIPSLQNKHLRIQSLQPFIKNGYLRFSVKHKTLLQQLTQYPMGKHDDGPDTLEMAVRIALTVIKSGTRIDYKSVISRALRFGSGSY